MATMSTLFNDIIIYWAMASYNNNAYEKATRHAEEANILSIEKEPSLKDNFHN